MTLDRSALERVHQPLARPKVGHPLESILLGMTRIYPECPDLEPHDRSLVAGVLFRQQPDDEEDEDEDDHDGKEDNDEDYEEEEEEDDGYSE